MRTTIENVSCWRCRLCVQKLSRYELYEGTSNFSSIAFAQISRRWQDEDDAGTYPQLHLQVKMNVHVCTCGACIVMLNARVERAVFSHEMYRSLLCSFSSSSSLLEPTCIYGRKRNSSSFAFIFLKGLTFLVPVLMVAFSLLMLISCCSGR